MKWMQFLTPVASMDAEEARAYMKEHKEKTTLCFMTLRKKKRHILAPSGVLWKQGAENQ